MKKSTINHPFYLFLRCVLRIPFRVIFLLKGFRMEGRSHLPRKRQAMVIISNHAAFMDSVYYICAVRPRIVICGARPKYFESFVTRHLFRTANIMMVEGEDQFVKDCTGLLEKGEILLIYPEMGRNPGGMGPFRTWAARAAASQRVPVLPCYLYGTTAGHHGPKRLFAGDPFFPEGDPESITERFRREIESLASVTKETAE